MPCILIVEDNEMSRDMLLRRLQRRGYRVLVAFDGAQAIHVTRLELPDLILMDMSLPVVDGWEVTRQLKEDEATAHIPVIALTAHAMAGDREKALHVGCDEYESKPLDFGSLLRKITALLPRRESG
jgi:two-component system cell cycle response regulator DivK